jgi:hypothetical protein
LPFWGQVRSRHGSTLSRKTAPTTNLGAKAPTTNLGAKAPTTNLGAKASTTNYAYYKLHTRS